MIAAWFNYVNRVADVLGGGAMSEDIQKDPHPPSGTEPPGAPPDYAALDYEEEPRFPRTVTAAGVLWIVVGGLFGPLSAVFLVLIVVAEHGPKGPLEEMQKGCADFIFAVLLFLCAGLAALFLFVGIRCVRGTALDTLATGIGSLFFALLVCSSAAGVTFLPGVVVYLLLCGTMLLAAGILALVGRSQYKLWRQAQEARRDRAAAERKARRQFVQ